MDRIAGNTPRFAALYMLIVAAAITYSTAGFALGTDEQRAACTPDVFRLCASEIPNDLATEKKLVLLLCPNQEPRLVEKSLCLH